jgi:hypothetical protein
MLRVSTTSTYPQLRLRSGKENQQIIIIDLMRV